jgi:hypothetical protein
MPRLNGARPSWVSAFAPVLRHSWALLPAEPRAVLEVAPPRVELVGWIDPGERDEVVWGHYSPTTNVVRLDWPRASRLPAVLQASLLFHELAHCVLYRVARESWLHEDAVNITAESFGADMAALHDYVTRRAF